MAQAGYTPIQLYVSTSAGVAPSAGNLANGELAINITDGKLFYKDNGGVVQVLATKGAGTIGGSTTQVQYNNAGALAGSANLTFDGTTLTAAGLVGPHNGTVGATTPNTGAFTTLTTSSTVTLSGGTANGVAYLNGSKVLTTGSALTFDGTNLGVVNAGSAGVNVQSLQSYLTLKSTGAFNPFINFYSSNTSLEAQIQGVAGGGSLVFALGSGATEQMRLTSTGLGIGTSSPGYKLDVSGGARITGTTIGPRFYGSGTGITEFMDSLGTTGMYVTGAGASPSNSIRFFSAGTTTAILDASGNLGLGVTPSAWYSGWKAIDVLGAALRGGTANGAAIYSNAYVNNSLQNIYKNSTYALQYQLQADTGAHAWFTAPSGTAGNAITFTQAMTLDANGDVQLGSTVNSFDARFYILRTTATEKNIAAFYTTGSHNTCRVALYNDSGSASVQSIAGNLSFSAGGVGSGSERARIDSSGNLLVGQTASGGNQAAGGIVLRNPTVGSGGSSILLSHATGVGSGNSFAEFSYGGSGIGNIVQVGTTAVIYNTTSDHRLKTVIGAVAGSGARIDALEPIEYEWKADGSRTRGFLAHKFQEVYAGSVTGTKDAVDAEGKPIYQAMQASSSEVIADLVAEIQSLRKRLAAAGIA